MMNSQLNGFWKSSYKYGDMYPTSFQKLSEAFTLELQFDGVNCKGICRDRFTDNYFSSPAEVQGTFVPNLISFIKKYPGRLTVDANLHTIVEMEKPSLEIHYTGFFYQGRFFPDPFVLKGNGSLPILFLMKVGKKNILAVVEPGR